MRLACTSKGAELLVVQIPLAFLLIGLELHTLYHQPPWSPQLTLGRSSLSLSWVLNIIPLEIQFGQYADIRASPASPLYQATVSWYLPASSLMEKVEYSAEYHRPEVRWIYSHRHTVQVTLIILAYSGFLTHRHIFRHIFVRWWKKYSQNYLHWN